jgi:hypothetical protein
MKAPPASEQIKTQLARVSHYRRANLSDFADCVLPIKAWQSARLARTYADLSAQKQYKLATAFFLDDLYGTKDFSQRDADIEKIVPTLIKILPEAALGMMADSISLDAISEELDQMMGVAWRGLGKPALNDEIYGAVYRLAGSKSMRKTQIDLVKKVSSGMSVLSGLPMISATLTTMKIPAKLVGMSDLHAFLERGFKAFKGMGDGTVFMGLVVGRETQISHNLYSQRAEPFTV